MSRAILFFALLGFAVTAPALAGERLPGLAPKKWLGCYIGHEGRKFEWAVRQNGVSVLYLLNRRERSTRVDKPEVRCVLEEQVDGRWVRRKSDDEDFEYSHEASTEVEESTITFSYTGDTKVAVTYKFDDEGVTMSARIAEKTTNNPLRFGFELVMPEVWSNSGDEELRERDLRDRIEDAEIRAVRTSDGKKLRYRLWESVKLEDEEHLGGGADEISIEIAKFGRGRVVLKPGADKTPLRVLHSRALYSGFRVAWFPPLEKLGEDGSQLSITVE